MQISLFLSKSNNRLIQYHVYFLVILSLKLTVAYVLVQWISSLWFEYLIMYIRFRANIY